MVSKETAAARAELIVSLTRHAQVAVTAIEHGDAKGGIERYMASLADNLAAEIGPDAAVHVLAEIILDAVDRWGAPLAALDVIRAKGGKHD